MDIWSPLSEGQSPLLFSPNQLIYLQDTKAEEFYYIQSGSVKCFLSAESGEERILTCHHAGELIGEAAFFDKQPRVSSAVAITPCALISVDRERLYAVFAKHPDLAVSMLEYLGPHGAPPLCPCGQQFSSGRSAHCPASACPSVQIGRNAVLHT